LEIIHHIADFVIHIDHHINSLVTHYGVWSYAILFAIIFCETGLVITPFLPGDSLLFVLGALAATADGPLDVKWVLLLLSSAAILGNIVNYQIGRMLAPKIFRNENIRFLNKEHLKRTQEFFDKHGSKTIIFTRFMPILRTCAPFLAGVGNMPYAKFSLYNIVGGLVWVFLFVLAGYFFGKVPFIEHNFSKVILVIIVVSLLPAIIEFMRHKKSDSK
jgi:membrane-associated protein